MIDPTLVPALVFDAGAALLIIFVAYFYKGE